MSLKSNIHFELINENKIKGYIYEVVFSESLCFQENEIHSFRIDYKFNFSPDYIELILLTNKAAVYLIITPEKISPIEIDLIIDVEYTGKTPITFEKGEKLGNLIVQKLSDDGISTNEVKSR